MKYVHNYRDFGSDLNENQMDSFKNIFSNVVAVFSDTEKLIKQVELSEVKIGDNPARVSIKSIKVGNTVMITLDTTQPFTEKTVIALTKIADTLNGSGIFHMSGTTNMTFLKSVMGMASDLTELNKVGILVLLGPDSVIVGKPLVMSIYKNIDREGKDNTSKGLVTSMLDGDKVTKQVIT